MEKGLFNGLFWTCHICKKERPDAKISVKSVDVSVEHELPKGTMQENIRYCNDNPDCIEKVKHFKLLKREKENMEAK